MLPDLERFVDFNALRQLSKVKSTTQPKRRREVKKFDK